jgi:hypothetical protein
LHSGIGWASLGRPAPAPVVQSIYAQPIDLRDTTAAPWAVTVNGAPATVTTAAQGDPVTVNLSLSTTPAIGDTVRITYTPPPHTVFSLATGVAAVTQTGEFVVS